MRHESKEMYMETKKNRKRTVVAVALVACLALAGTMGVMAWYSAQSEITNTFTTGNIQPPTTDPTDPGAKDPLQPGVDPSEGGHKGQMNGNIVEDAWIPNSHIAAGSTVAKNPNVGISPKSDAAYVFVYVDNNLGTGTHFKLNENWKAVEATQYNGVSGEYTGGLFMYVGKGGADATMLAPDTVGGLDVWTGEVFSSVTADADAVIQGNPQMKVSAYMVAKSSANEKLDAKTATDAAKVWVTNDLKKLV